MRKCTASTLSAKCFASMLQERLVWLLASLMLPIAHLQLELFGYALCSNPT
jgi:hypothetical protein